MSESSGFWSIAVRIARTMRDSTFLQHRNLRLYKELCPSSLQCPPCEDSRMRIHRPQTLVVRIEGEDVFYPYCLQDSRPWKYRIEGCFVCIFDQEVVRYRLLGPNTHTCKCCLDCHFSIECYV